MQPPMDLDPDVDDVRDPAWLVQAREGRCHTDDLLPPGCLHAAFVRSPHASALIESVDADVHAHDGVVAILTAADLPPEWRPIPCIVPVTNRDGSQRADPPHTLLARERVRHEGEAVAMVVARGALQARRAASRLAVRYRVLPAVSDAQAALDEQAPRVWPEMPGNVCFDWELGDCLKSDAAFASAAHVVRLTLRNNRVVVAPLETRNAIAWHDSRHGRSVLVTATQGVHWTRDVIARDVLGIDPAALEVITPQVGGSFGAKIFVYPEQVLVLAAARRLGLPVKWSASRTEAFLTDTQGRDHHTCASMALDEEGRMLAVRADTLANLGAHLSNYAPFNATTCGAPLLGGCYRIGSVYTRVRGLFTHTPPVDSYRGAGRPEANYVVERLIDEAARHIGMDRAELRRRNLIRADDFPFTTATGLRIDSGMFQQNLAQALEIADYAGFERRRSAAAAQGRLRGIGLANFVEANGGMALARLMEPGGKPRETARLSFVGGGTRVRLDIGTQGSGQGHALAYARIAGEALGVPAECIDVFQGRTDRLAQGTGTGGSKSMLSGSTAILQAAGQAREKARQWVAAAWGVPAPSLEWRGAVLSDARGRAMSMVDLARLAAGPALHPFDQESTVTIPTGTYGNGCHVCEVDVDPATGECRIAAYVAVNDFGTIVMPALAEAQLHGGIAQGIGQALHEDCRFDPGTGQLETADFGRYHLPQASRLPRFDIRFNGAPCTTNPLGLKGCGEAGTSAAPPAVINALQHALDAGAQAKAGDRVQMPATAAQLWRLLHATQEVSA